MSQLSCTYTMWVNQQPWRLEARCSFWQINVWVHSCTKCFQFVPSARFWGNTALLYSLGLRCAFWEPNNVPLIHPKTLNKHLKLHKYWLPLWIKEVCSDSCLTDCFFPMVCKQLTFATDNCYIQDEGHGHELWWEHWLELVTASTSSEAKQAKHMGYYLPLNPDSYGAGRKKNLASSVSSCV